MTSDQSTSPDVEVVPNRNDFKHAIESLTGDPSEPVSEEQLRRQVASDLNYQIADNERVHSIQIAEAVEIGLLQRGPEEDMVQLGSEDVEKIRETRIL